MNNLVEKEIIPLLSKPNISFVFLNETNARSMLMAVLQNSNYKALPKNRFISWDTFKINVFNLNKKEKPVNKAIRLIFAKSLCAENAETPFIHAFIPTSMAAVSDRFAPVIASALPSLIAIKNSLVKSPYIDDWKQILNRYEKFIKENNLYEPQWIDKNYKSNAEESWVFVYTDLSDDWHEYEPVIKTMSNVKLISAEGLETKNIPARKYSTVLEEVRSTIISILNNLTTVRASDIVISLADMDAMLPVLKREAVIAGLPLDIHDGIALYDSAGGKIIQDIVSCAQTNMSFESVRRLFFNKSRPWKNIDTIKALINVAIKEHIVSPVIIEHENKSIQNDVWELSIQNSALKQFYKLLKKSINKIYLSKTFSSLRNNIDEFKKEFIDDAKWNEDQNNEIARCLFLLDEIDADKASVNINLLKKTDAIDIYIAILKETLYVPTSYTGGIAVYRFPVASCIMPKFHYILNITQNSASNIIKPLAFIRQDERAKLKLIDKEISSQFLLLFSKSGQNVTISYSETGVEGVRPPHPALTVSKLDQACYSSSMWPTNTSYNTKHNSKVFAMQKLGAKIALTTILDKNKDTWNAYKYDKPLILGSNANILPKLQDNKIVLSASSINSYLSCTFRHVFNNVLNIWPLKSGLSFIDNIFIGQIYHKAFELLFSELAAKRTPIDSYEIKQDKLDFFIDESINILASAPMSRLLIKTQAPKLKKYFFEAVNTLAPELHNAIPIMADTESLKKNIPDSNIILEGRPDLVCIKTIDGVDNSIVVDYKKSSIPSKAELTANSENSVPHVQIPIYAFLVSSSYSKTISAYYLSIEKANIASVDDTLLSIDSVISTIHQAAEIAINNKIFVPSYNDMDEICALCHIRPVCRAHYTIK